MKNKPRDLRSRLEHVTSVVLSYDLKALTRHVILHSLYHILCKLAVPAFYYTYKDNYIFDISLIYMYEPLIT